MLSLSLLPLLSLTTLSSLRRIHPWHLRLVTHSGTRMHPSILLCLSPLLLASHLGLSLLSLGWPGLRTIATRVSRRVGCIVQWPLAAATVVAISRLTVVTVAGAWLSRGLVSRHQTWLATGSAWSTSTPTSSTWLASWLLIGCSRLTSGAWIGNQRRTTARSTGLFWLRLCWEIVWHGDANIDVASLIIVLSLQFKLHILVDAELNIIIERLF